MFDTQFCFSQESSSSAELLPSEDGLEAGLAAVLIVLAMLPEQAGG